MIAASTVTERPEGNPSFLGSLPSLRFATGSILFLTGLAGFFGLKTGQDWLSRGAAHWIEICPLSAQAFMAFGALMMASWSRAARETCWILMCIVGAASLLHHYAVWSGTSLGPLEGWLGEDRPAMKPVAAFLLLVTGVRIWAATRAHQVAPVLDGIILGIAVASLLGYVTGFRPLYSSSLFGGLSYLETIGFLTIGGLFLLADIEYARLNLRVRRLPAALGIASFAATVSLRISEAVLDSLGRDGFEVLLTGQISVQAMALGATNTLMSIAIGAAAMFLIMTYDSTTRAAAQDAAQRRRAESDLVRVAGGLDGLLADAATRGPGTALPAPPLYRSRTEVAGLAEEVIKTSDLAERRLRVLTNRAAGHVHADPTWLAQALHQMFSAAANGAAGYTPLVSMRLDREPGRRVVRMAFGGAIAPGPFRAAEHEGDSAGCTEDRPVAHALGIADAVARWHGGGFWATSNGHASTLHLAVPGETGGD